MNNLGVRCGLCDAPAIEQGGRVGVPHLSWCRRAPRQISAPTFDASALRARAAYAERLDQLDARDQLEAAFLDDDRSATPGARSTAANVSVVAGHCDRTTAPFFGGATVVTPAPKS